MLTVPLTRRYNNQERRRIHWTHVYWKKTHTSRYTPSFIIIQNISKWSVARTLASRLISLRTPAHVLKKIKETLHNNRYSKQQFYNALNQKKKKQDTTQPARKVTLPYLKGTTDKIAKILRTHDIIIAFKRQTSIHWFIGIPMDEIPLEDQRIKFLEETGAGHT